MVNLNLSMYVLLISLLLSGCGGGENEGASNNIPATSAAYIVVAWNDLGMHCLNPSYDSAVILPPHNNLFAQVIKRGNKPQIVSSGLTVSYRILNNTDSYDKGGFKSFWTNAVTLFQGLFPSMSNPLPKNIGLTGNGLSGAMTPNGSHFEVSGIPVVPYDDGSTVRNPYQVAEVTVKDGAGNVVALTRATVPTSDEINCGKCHGNNNISTFDAILNAHDAFQGAINGKLLRNSKPVLCASCHGSPALGAPLKQNPNNPGATIPYLSQAIHSFHAGSNVSVKPTCYDCHPGASTKCNRSTQHTASDGNCTNVSCHGSLSNVASTIAAGRVPWLSEPKCVNCHTSVSQVDTETLPVPQKLYRNAVGHGGVFCAGCHGSPHAMVPSNEPKDNFQALQYQGVPYVLGDCRTCHSSSRGGGNNFTSGEAHGSGRPSACNVCHTGFQNAGNTANWPHQFQWKDRR